MRHLLVLIAAAPLAACTTSGHVTEPGESIYTLDVRKLVLESSGGFAPSSPPGAACAADLASYTLTVGSHQLAWQFCDVTVIGSDATYTPHVGSRTLDDGEWGALQPTLRALVVSGGGTCGADKPEVATTVTTSAGDLEYGDDFYACQDHSKPYIVTDALGSAEHAFNALARE